MGTIYHLALNGIFMFAMITFLMIDSNITTDPSKLVKLIQNECQILEKNMDKKEFFEKGIIKIIEGGEGEPKKVNL